MDYLIDDRHFQLPCQRILLGSAMQPGENPSTLKVRILLTCGTFAIIFTVLCLLAVCLAKCCRSSSAESSDQETINNDARNRPTTAAKKREQVVEEVLTTFPAYTYGVDKSPPPQQWKSCSDGAVCSICLGEYQEGECLRLLPKCGHVFHKGCIDLWLSTRSSSCPICRDQAVAVTNMDLSSGDGGVRGSERIPIPSWSISFGTVAVAADQQIGESFHLQTACHLLLGKSA